MSTSTLSGCWRIVNDSFGSTRAVRSGVGVYAAAKCAVNILSDVARVKLADDNVRVILLLPSITATEFGGGMFQDCTVVRPGGMVAHSSEYVGRVVLRGLRTGEARIDIALGEVRRRPEISLRVPPREPGRSVPECRPPGPLRESGGRLT